MTHAFLTLSRAASLEAEVARIGARTRQTCRFVRSAEDVLASIAASPRAIILDGEHAETAAVLERLAAAPLDGGTLVVVVTSDVAKEPIPGAHVLVTENSLQHVLATAGLPQHERPVRLDRLLAMSVLGGQLDQALERAADEVTECFGVDRCVIAGRSPISRPKSRESVHGRGRPAGSCGLPRTCSRRSRRALARSSSTASTRRPRRSSSDWRQPRSMAGRSWSS
jgi:hypothetical protein